MATNADKEENEKRRTRQTNRQTVCMRKNEIEDEAPAMR